MAHTGHMNCSHLARGNGGVALVDKRLVVLLELDARQKLLQLVRIRHGADESVVMMSVAMTAVYACLRRGRAYGDAQRTVEK